MFKRIFMANLKRIVKQYDLKNNFIKEFLSMESASIETKTNYGSIANCCRGKRKTANGFIWKYDDNYFRVKSDALDKELFKVN